MLRCPSCQKCVSPLQVLEHCSVSWPNQQWLLFECPICKKHSHVQVSDGLMELGELDGTPGPCFCADTTLDLPGLKVVCASAQIQCTLEDRQFNIPAR